MECPVCYENKNLVTINCKHKYCKACLKKIIKTKENYPNDHSLIPCPYCRRDIIKTNNKCINRILNYFNEIQIMKQRYPMMRRTRIIIHSIDNNNNKHTKIKNYPDKLKFKSFQNY